MKKIVLKSRPAGEVAAENFQFIEDQAPDAAEGEVLLKALYFSVDPYMRNRMNNVESYVTPYEIGAVIKGDAIGRVIQSNSSLLKEGDLVAGVLPWQEFCSRPADRLHKIEVDDKIPPTAYLGVLGLPGLTAYFGMLEIARPQTEETVVISGAAGAVGSIAGQLAKIKGCRTIGICGSELKVKYLTEELGFDQAIDYKKMANIRRALRNICPEKVDIYFDNVGGDISDGVFYWLNNFSRVVLCGQIALYNQNRLSMGPRLFPQFVIRRTRLQGFIVYDYSDRFSTAVGDLKLWMKEGKISLNENIIDGFEQIPHAFMGLFSGQNIGKQLVRVA
jgi:NADPH-dependent curcumin reductase CurA